MAKMSNEAFELILGQCTHPEFSFRLGGTDSETPYLQVVFDAPCSKTGAHEHWKGRKWQLSRFMVKGEIVQTCFMAVMTALEHEAREHFKFKGQAIFGPHFDVDRLVSMASDPTSIVERN